MTAADWGQGYVTDIDYIYGFTSEMAPIWLRTIGKLQNVRLIEKPIVYLELGCGQGYGLNVLAASSPADSFIGVDFNPAHVVSARRLADSADLGNIKFLEEGFEHIAATPSLIPDCDVIALHGVYSWIGPAQRQAIKDIIRQRLKPGGAVYISYNCSVGWGRFAGFQRLLRDLTLARGGGSGDISKTLERLTAYRDAGLAFFKDNPALSSFLDLTRKSSNSYLAHEYLNEHWTPFFSSDVARDMSECKLTYVGSCRPAENVDYLSLPSTLTELVNSEPSHELQENMRDLAVSRLFRRDIFVRGKVAQPAKAWIESIGSIALALLKPRDEVEMKAGVPIGTLTMNRPAYVEILGRIADTPTQMRAMVSDASSWASLVTVLVQSGAAHPALADGVDAAAARRFNRVIMSTEESRRLYAFAASPLVRSGLPIAVEDREALAKALDRPGIAIDELMAELPEQKPPTDTSEPPPRSRQDVLGGRLALWRQHQIID